MGFIQQYLLLRGQKKSARKDMKQKEMAITHTGYDVAKEEKICLKQCTVVGIGVGYTGGIEIEVDRCDDFHKAEYCDCEDCVMLQKNHEYIDAVKKYKVAKGAQWNFVKSALKFRKH